MPVFMSCRSYNTGLGPIAGRSWEWISIVIDDTASLPFLIFSAGWCRMCLLFWAVFVV